MSNSYARGLRRQHVYFAQDNDEIVVHFTRPEWPEIQVHLTSDNGMVTVRIEQDGVSVTVPLFKLTDV